MATLPQFQLLLVIYGHNSSFGCVAGGGSCVDPKCSDKDHRYWIESHHDPPILHSTRVLDTTKTVPRLGNMCS